MALGLQQLPNTFLAGPVSGDPEQATYRAITLADLPGGSGGGTGTVTSVGLLDSSTTTLYTVTGSPVTTSGSLTITLSNQSANTIFAGPGSGGGAQPAFRSLVAADLPNIDANTLTGTTLNASIVTSSLTSVGTITSGTWTGTTLAIANGGTGQTSATNAINALVPSQTGNSGKFLSTNGTAVSWAASSGSGTVTTASVVTANGFAGTVATATTTPAITLTTSITGVLKGNGTAISAAIAADFPTLNQSTTGNAATATALATPRTINTIAFDGSANITVPAPIPQNFQTGSYTAVLSDANGQIQSSSGSATTKTIPANSSVAFPIGTTLTFVNFSAGLVTIAITTDTLTWCPSGTTGSRTLAQFGIATAMKVASTSWYISGVGLT